MEPTSGASQRQQQQQQPSGTGLSSSRVAVLPGAIPSAPPWALPSLDWVRQLLASFMELRSEVHRMYLEGGAWGTRGA